MLLMIIMVVAERLGAETNTKTLQKKEYMIMHVIPST